MEKSTISQYPHFSPISIDMKNELDSLLDPLSDGLSELTFLNLYLFKSTYHYLLSVHNSMLIIKGCYKGIPFFITPRGVLSKDVVLQLLRENYRWSFLSESFLEVNKNAFKSEEFKKLKIEEDRDNFDYVYLRENLATLAGKEFHKKKTHINKFEKTYTNIEIKKMTLDNLDDARIVLEDWQNKREDKDADYLEAKEALCLIDDSRFNIVGIIVYVDGKPIGWSIAEVRANKTAIVLFEKALPEYKGSFQYLNYCMARFLSEDIIYINREQDLGDEGLRQAKMTYRPIKFIKKYHILPV